MYGAEHDRLLRNTPECGKILVPRELESPWHAGMGTRGHTCNYCLAWKPSSMSRQFVNSRKTMPIVQYRNQRFKANYEAALARRALYSSIRRPLSFPSRMSVGGKANIVRYQQTHPGGEIKSLDTVSPSNNNVQTPFTLNSTGSVTVLNPITIGSSMWNRIGRKVAMKSIYVQGMIVETNVSNAYITYNRMVLIYDKQPNGALPQLSDIFLCQTNSASDANLSNIWCGINLNNRDRFEIIRDWRFTLPPSTASAGSPTAVVEFTSVNEYAKLGNRETHFKADSSPGVIGDIATGSLLMVTWGSYTAGGEPYALYVTCRLRYSDL